MIAQHTSEQKRRIARKSMPKPAQIELFEGIALAPAKPAEPAAPKVAAQSPRAAKIAAETTMQTEAKRVLAKKAAKAAKPKAAKPKVRVMKP